MTLADEFGKAREAAGKFVSAGRENTLSEYTPIIGNMRLFRTEAASITEFDYFKQKR